MDIWKNKDKLLRIIVLMVCTIIMLYLLINYYYSQYFFLIGLIVSFFILSALYPALYKIHNPMCLLTLCFILIKYVISPFFLIITDNTCVFNNNIESLKYAVILMIYDLLVLWIIIFILDHLRKSKVKKNNNINNKNKIGLILGIFVLYVVVVFIFFSEARDMFKTILSITDETFTWDSTYDASGNYTGFKRIILTLFTLIFRVVRFIFPIYVFSKIKSLKCKELFKVLISIAIVLFQFCFITSTIAETFIVSLTLIYFLCQLYPIYRNKMLVALSIIGLLIIIILMGFRFTLDNNIYSKGENFVGYISKVLASYFPGVNTIASDLHFDPKNKLELFFTTISYSIPFNTTLFGKRSYSYSSLFNIASMTTGQIPSSLSMGATFFTPFFAPIFSSCIAVYGIKIGEKIKNITNLQNKSLYFIYGFYLVSSIGIYNFQIALTYIFNLVLFIFIIILWNRWVVWKK